MRREPITFRDLLERVLPLDRLPTPEQARVQRVLATASATEVERAAMSVLERLAQRGYLLRLPDRTEAGEHVFRFQNPDTHEIVALRYPVPDLPPGLLTYPRALASLRVSTSVDKVRRLLSLDEALIREDNRLPSGAAELIGLLERSARELVECEEAIYFPAGEQAEAASAYAPPAGEAPFLERWLSEAVLASDLLLVCPDAAAVPALRSAAQRHGWRSLAGVRVSAGGSRLEGVLEVRSRQVDAFDLEKLSLLSLLSENFASLLDKASRLERLVFVDSLTGAYNTTFFDQALGREVARARREHESMALLIVDIDDFKRFNTLYGYEGGNTVLQRVAAILAKGVRPFDSVARWGGEEFAVLLTAPLSREDAEHIAERLRHSVADAEHTIVGLDRREHVARVSVSVGAALYPDDCRSQEELWRLANQALLRAKEPPKGKVVFWSPEPRKGTAQDSV